MRVEIFFHVSLPSVLNRKSEMKMDWAHLRIGRGGPVYMTQYIAMAGKEMDCGEI